MLPFEGYDFYRGIVTNPSLGFKKDAVYDFLKNPGHDRRKFLLSLSVAVARFFAYPTDEKRIKVLIFDDSAYDRCRSGAVELPAWIRDRNSGRSLKGFRMPEAMVKRVLCAGLRVDYILMDSRFCFPAISAAPGRHVPVICMTKTIEKIRSAGVIAEDAALAIADSVMSAAIDSGQTHLKKQKYSEKKLQKNAGLFSLSGFYLDEK